MAAVDLFSRRCTSGRRLWFVLRMRIRFSGEIVVWFLLAAAFMTAVAEAQVGAGTKLTPPSFRDQHEATQRIDETVRVVLFTRDMDAGKLVKEALAENGAEQLGKARAVYVSDISAMPSMVTRLFALPSMRKRGYPILLDRDGSLTRDLPAQNGKVTLLELRHLEVVAVKYLDSAQGVRDALAVTQP